MDKRSIARSCMGWRLLILFACGVTSVYAQGYPNRPVRLVVPLAPGGAGDIVARTVAAKLSEMFDTLITSIPQLKAGRLRALGVTLSRRSSSLPDVPTLAESGVPGYRFEAWQSIVLPAGTGKDIINKIQADTVRVLALPDVRRKLIDEGANELVGSSPEQLASLIRSDIEKYRKLIRDAGVSAH